MVSGFNHISLKILDNVIYDTDEKFVINKESSLMLTELTNNNMKPLVCELDLGIISTTTIMTLAGHNGEVLGYTTFLLVPDVEFFMISLFKLSSDKWVVEVFPV